MRKAFGQNKKTKINNAKHDYINCTMWQNNTDRKDSKWVHISSD